MAAESTMLPLGTPLPDFTLPDPEGNPHGPSDHADAPGLLVFFACNHCPYVVHVGPELGRISKDWQARGLAILAINSNDSEAYPDDAPELMPGFAAGHGWSFPYLVDATQEVARTYQAACTPDFFLFDREQMPAGRKLVYRGRFDASRPGSSTPLTGEDLGAAVDAVLAGEPVPEGTQYPSIGCSIKWK